MCVRSLLDTNLFSRFVNDDRDGPMGRFRAWVEQGHGRLVYARTGRYHEELQRAGRIRDRFEAYRRANRAQVVNKKMLAESAGQIDPERTRSNDQHVLEIAIAGAALVLATGDRDLRRDFRDRTLLPALPSGNRAAYPLNATPKVQREFLEKRKCPRRI